MAGMTTALPEVHPLVDGRTGNAPLVRASRGQRSATLPVWFMRQAGRSLPEYRKLREGVDMLDACLRPELASEITLQPVRRHGVDAAVFFSDIVVPMKLLGVDVDIVPGRGPVFANPIRDRDAVREFAAQVRDQTHPELFAPISEAVAISVDELDATPLIGFAGAPFTLAAYLVEGGPSKDHLRARALMRAEPDAWNELATAIGELSAAFLEAQIMAGASVVQLFDSWAGSLSVETYERSVAPSSRIPLERAAQFVTPDGERVRSIHFGVGTGELLQSMHATGGDVQGVDDRIPLDEAARRLPGVPLQGNIDPAALFAGDDALAAHTRDVVARGAAAPAHIVNLGHGVPANVDPTVLTRLVDFVHRLPGNGVDERSEAQASQSEANQTQAIASSQGGARMSPAAVLGGGISGLLAAFRIAQAEVTITTLYEASDRLGGMLLDGSIHGIHFDLGAESFAIRGGAVEGLIHELGLDEEVVEPRQLGSWAYGSEGAYRLPPAGAMGLPAVLDDDMLRAAVGDEGVAQVYAERELDPAIGEDAATLAELVRARFGERVLQRLVAPVARGVYSIDPEDVDPKVIFPHVFKRLRTAGSLGAAAEELRSAAPAGALVKSIRGGMFRLVQVLEQEIRQRGVQVHLETPMTAAEMPLTVNHILVTAGSAIGDHSTPISTEVVALMLDAPELNEFPRGTGVLVSDATDVRAKALTHSNAKWEWLDEKLGDNRHLVRLSYGPETPDGPAVTQGMTDAGVRRLALADASAMFGVELSTENVVGMQRQHWDIPTPSSRIGRVEELAQMRAQIDAAPRVDACGTWIDGTGLAIVVPAVDAAVARILAVK